MLTAIAIATGLTLVLFLTGLFVVLTPLPVAMTFLKKGAFAALVVCAIAMAALILLYRLPGEPLSFLPMMVFYPAVSSKGVLGLSAIYLLYFLWLGWAIAVSSRRTGRLSTLEPSIALITVSALAVTVASLFAFAAWTKMDLAGDVGRGLQALFQKMIDLQKSSGIDDEDLAFLRSAAPLVVTKFFQFLPSLWIDLTLAVVSLTVLFLRRWTTAERPFPNWPDFGLWRLQEAWIWLPIASGFVYFLNAYLIQSSPLGVVVINVLIVVAAVYFFQGLAVTSFFFRSKLPPLLRMAGYALFLLFFQVGAFLVIALGLADFWFDFRKLKKVA
jgi:predicted membrane protein DUF2232